MAVKILDVTVPAATLQAFTASHYYWIDKDGNGTDAGTALATTAAVPMPSDRAVLDVSMFQAVEVQIQHAALTNGVGGKCAIAELAYDAPLDTGTVTGAPRVLGSTTDQALAATLEFLKVTPVNAPTSARMAKIALALLWTTVPTAGSAVRLVVIGHRDGQDRQRG